MINYSWSKQYYKDLTEVQHQINDDWFKTNLNLLTDIGILYVPNLQKFFNKNGEEVQRITEEIETLHSANRDNSSRMQNPYGFTGFL